jgi:hypothetical protein
MRLGDKGQAQWGTGRPGNHRRGGCRWRGRGRTDTVGAKAGKEGRDIPRIRQGESFEGTVVVKGEAKKFGGDRVGFGMI